MASGRGTQGAGTETSSLARLRELAGESALRAPSVSAWSVGMHTHHCALAAIEICRALRSSTDPPPRTWRSLVGQVVLWRGRLPRGRATAPAVTVPVAELSPPDLMRLLGEATGQIEQARTFPARSWFGHFALGTLRRDDALRFIEVHTRHHLGIVNEIVTACAANRAGFTPD